MTMSWCFQSSRLLLVLLATSCTLLACNAGAQDSPSKIIETDYSRSIVRILTSGRDAQGRQRAEIGTGVIVSEGTILTARHVIGRDDEWYQNAGRPDRHVDVMVVDEDNSSRMLVQGAAVRVDSNVDAALVFFNPGKRVPAEVNFAERVDGATAYAFVWDKTSSIPEVRSAEIARTDVTASGPGLRLVGQFRQGHSGAPVFDSHGRVRGIIVKGDDTNQYTLALPLAAFRTLLLSAPKFSEFRRFRSRQNDRLPRTVRNAEAFRVAALTKARRAVRDEAAGFVEGYFFEHGSRIDPEKAMEIADALIVIESEQNENPREGFVELATRSSGVLEVALLDAAATKLKDSAQAEELQRARARERDLLLEIERLKSKLAGVEKAASGNTALQTEISDALAGKSDELRSNDLLRRALVAKSLGRSRQANEILDKLVQEYPKLESARAQRGQLEDYAYLVASRSTVSAQAYRSLARSQFEKGDPKGGRETLRLLRSLFPNFGVVEISLVSSKLKDLGPMVVEYLTLEMPDGSYVPPWSLKRDLVVANNSVVILSPSMDFTRYREFTLKFVRYGYYDCLIKMERSELELNNITTKSCSIERDERPIVGNYQISGTALLNDQSVHGEIVVVVTNRGKLAGFSKITQTDSKGLFRLGKLPEGDNFELRLSKDGYVPRTVSFALRNEKVICWSDESGRYLGQEHQCDFTGFEFRLHPIREVTIEWQLQETPGLGNFRASISKGRVVLFTALRYDWKRGGWWCCEASYRFGSQEINVEQADILAFTELDGKIFLAQPQSRSIARVSIDYDQLIDIPPVVEFSETQEISAGATFLIKTSALLADQEPHYVKLRILSVK
jgi:tetratricopeptide (TPR) repeat protein